jgi:hypothetical protein
VKRPPKNVAPVLRTIGPGPAAEPASTAFDPDASIASIVV